ncbi:MAG: DUF3987 domain-containing protein [Bryobacteraceae bacterium]
MPDGLCVAVIPEELRARPQWVVWWSVTGEGRAVKLPNGHLTRALKAQKKPHKLPIDPRTGTMALSTNPTTWGTSQQAIDAAQQWSMTGVGFVFSDVDPYAGVDLDDCRNPDTGEITEWGWAIIRGLNSYTEVSPSGTGVHIIVRGMLPAGKGNQVVHHGGKVEMFSRARYFTFTGIHVDETPVEILDRQDELLRLHRSLFASRKCPAVKKDLTVVVPLADADDELLARARHAQNGAKFERLWNGQWEGDYPSQSEADLALCCHLAFWTRNDAAQVDRLFRCSSLMRQKWLREDYREETIARAISGSAEGWSPAGSVLGGRTAKASEQNAHGGTKAAEWEPPVPLSQFELPTFPTKTLPAWLRAYVEALATATQTPVDLAGMLSLSILSAACAKKVIVRIKEGYEEPVNIFTVTALPSGSRKTAVFSAVAKPLVDYEQAEAKRTAREIAQQHTAYKIKESTLKRNQEQAVTATGTQRQKLIEEAQKLAAELAETSLPVAARFIVDDCTPEKLPGLLRDQGGRMAVLSAEGDVFDLMAGRYSPNKVNNFGVYLRGHAGDAIRVDRVGRAPEFIEAPALTMGLAVQPDVIVGLAQQPGFRERGLLARFLYSLPANLLGRRDTDPPSVPEYVRTAYHDNVLALLRIPFGKKEGGERTHEVLTLDQDAQHRLQLFQQSVEPQLSEFGEMGNMTDWGGKLVGAVVRIAGLLHMAECADAEASRYNPISLNTISQAIRIGEYLIPHAWAAFALMGTDEAIENAKAILRWIGQKGLDHFQRRDVQQAMRGRFKRAAEVEAPLAILVEHGMIRQRPEKPIDGPGRSPSPMYDVNPLYASSRRGNSEDSE